MNLRIISTPDTEPLTLAEARLHLKLDAEGSPESHPDDSLVQTLISAAREHVETFTGLKIATTLYELRLDDFTSEILLTVGPVSGISHITYIDGDGATQTVSTSIYELDDDPTAPKVVRQYNQEWPEHRGDDNGVRVRFTVGYTDDESPDTNPMPASLKQAMLLLIGHWYRTREAVADRQMTTVPLAVESLLRPYRIRLGMV